MSYTPPPGASVTLTFLDTDGGGGNPSGVGRRPLVLVDGKVSELPQGDALDSAVGPVVENSFVNYTLGAQSMFDLTLSSNTTFTFPTPLAGRHITLLLSQTLGIGDRVPAWPANVRWAGGTAPTITQTAAKTDVLTFLADGTYWLGFVSGQNYTRA